MRSKPDREISRDDKGVTVAIHPEYVMKHYHAEPAHISAEEQARRLQDEVDIYRRFAARQCPFAPDLLGYSMKERKFFISRLEGEDLLSLALRGVELPVGSILTQLDTINAWLRRHDFPDMGNNIKDLILDPGGRVRVVDFECDYPSRKPDFYNAIVADLAQRWLGVGAKLGKSNRQIRRLWLAVLKKRPLATIRCTAYYSLLKIAKKLREEKR